MTVQGYPYVHTNRTDGYIEPTVMDLMHNADDERCWHPVFDAQCELIKDHESSHAIGVQILWRTLGIVKGA